MKVKDLPYELPDPIKEISSQNVVLLQNIAKHKVAKVQFDDSSETQERKLLLKSLYNEGFLELYCCNEHVWYVIDADRCFEHRD